MIGSEAEEQGLCRMDVSVRAQPSAFPKCHETRGSGPRITPSEAEGKRRNRELRKEVDRLEMNGVQSRSVSALVQRAQRRCGFLDHSRYGRAPLHDCRREAEGFFLGSL